MYRLILAVFVVLLPILLLAEIRFEEVEDTPMVSLINDMMILSEHETDDLRIRVVGFYIAPGSGGRSGEEKTMTVYIAVSEHGEYPDKRLYKLDPIHSPSDITWDSNHVAHMEYSVMGQPVQLSFEASLEGIQVSTEVTNDL